MNRFNFYEKISDGFSKINKEAVANEAAKTGRFRGANSGCITEDGIILGGDPRIAVLRCQGISNQTTIDDELLFQAGHSNEDGLAQWMTASGMNFQQEEECPVTWEVSAGGITYP